MARRLEGKKVFVTAAAQGMGRAAVLAMAREGARIIATDIREDLLQTLRAEVLAEGGIAPDVRRLDVTEPGAIESMMGSVGALDVLFNCAGYVHQGTILQASDDDWDLSFAINVRSMVRTIRSALPAMIAQGGGSIINVASDAGRVGAPRQSVYAGSKAGVIGFSKALVTEVSKFGIRINVVSPSTTDTPLLREALSADQIQRREKAIPLGRIGQPDDLASAIAFFASDDSAYITGQVLSVNGGSSRLG